MAHSEDDKRAGHALEAIARILNVPLKAFFEPSIPAIGRPPSSEEEVELLSLFRGIRDPLHRQRCLNLLRTMACPTEDASETTAAPRSP